MRPKNWVFPYEFFSNSNIQKLCSMLMINKILLIFMWLPIAAEFSLQGSDFWPPCQKNLKELTKVGQRTPQIANQKQIFGLIPLTPIRKFLRCATPQKIFKINMKAPNPQISTKYCTTLSQNSPKSRLFKPYFITDKFGGLQCCPLLCLCRLLFLRDAWIPT